MERYYNVHEAYKILKKHYVTDSLQMVTRYIRDGKLLAERSENRKDGWRIKEEDLVDFIDGVHNGIVPIIAQYEDSIDRMWLNTTSVTKEIVAKKEFPQEAQELNEPTHNEVVQQSVSTVMNEEKLDEIINLLKSTNKLLINLSEARATEAPAKEEQKTSHPGGMHSSKIFEVFITDLKDKVANEYLNDQQTLKDVYDVYYDTNGQMKNEVISPNGSFCCPITKEQKKTFLPLIKITVPKIFDKFKEDSEEEEYAVNESKEPELGEMNIPIDN